MQDRFGNIIVAKGGFKCRCTICGRKNAGGNKIRNSYIAVGLEQDEDGIYSSSYSKKNSHKVRRLREKRIWKAEIG